MQAITLAIGESGIQLFAQRIVAAHIIDLLKNLPAPDRSVPVAGRWKIPCDKSLTEWEVRDSTFSIHLTQGSVQSLDTKCTAIAQDPNDRTLFQCTFQAGPFTAKYKWTEKYLRDEYVYLYNMGWVWYKVDEIVNTYDYTPGFTGLTMKVKFQFTYDPVTGWTMIVQGKPQINTTDTSANIPKDSAVQYSSNKCQFGHSVSDAVLQALNNIDFSPRVDEVIQGVIGTVPASGDLGDGIQYDFSSGTDGLKFPAPNSIQMGVKGGASYNEEPYVGENPPTLPLPSAPTEPDIDLNMYVSDYEVNALNWAYYSAKKLDMLIKPGDLVDARALHVATYTVFEPKLIPYSAFVMYAKIAQNTAPVTAFQLVYLFTKKVMEGLEQLLPGNVYQLIQGLDGAAYVSLSTLNDFLTSATVPTNWFDTIAEKSKLMAMILTQDMGFSLSIQNAQPTLPEINFRVQRVDVMSALGLGINTHHNQTLQYAFTNALNTATFVGTSIPGFNGPIFGTVIWPVTAEPLYAYNLNEMGKTGVPLPIMQGFEFNFDNPELSLQQGYVSIKANVLYKSESGYKAFVKRWPVL